MRSSLALRSRTFDINLPCALLATTLLLVPQLVYAATPATPATPAAKATGSSSGDLDRAENTVLVTELRAVDVNAEEAKALTAFVAEAYAKATSYNVMTVAELNEVASLQKNLHDMECADDSCMAELSRIANARYVLSGTIGKIGDNLTITLSLLDADTTENIGTGTATAPDMDKLREVIPDAVAQVSQNLSGGEVVRYKLPEGREISFAVMSLKPLGIGKGVATNLTEVLAAEIKSIDGTSVISPSDIQSMLQMEAQKDALDCNDQACLAEIGGALGVDQLVVGNVGKVGKRFVVSLRIVDARSPKALSRVNESFEGLESQLVASVRHAGRTLLGIESKDTGALVVEATEDEVQAALNGKVIGTLPSPTLGNFLPGKHSLLLKKSGFIDWRSDVYIAPNGTTKIWVKMQETPVKWVFWGFVATTVATALGGGSFGALAVREDGLAQDRLADGLPGLEDHRRQADSYALTSNVFWTSTAVLGAGSLVAAYLTNWD